MRFFAMAAVALTACAPQPAPVDAKTEAPDPLAACDGNKAKSLLGRTVDAALKAEAMRLVGARGVRVIAPGAMVTMDYRTDRLNIDTDDAGKATRFHCG